MSTDWRSAYTKCPFYKTEDGKKVECEGVHEKTSINIVFTSTKEKIKYKAIYCESSYQECPYAKLLYNKWDTK